MKNKILNIKSFLVIIILFLFITHNSNNLYSQSIVVSEYFNATNADDEWIELVVIKDGLNIVGFSVRDNVENLSDLGNPNKWIGGVMFRDNALWRNLRAGTVIVINSRGTDAVDTDPSDGYIEIDAENFTYFDKICFNCDEANWGFEALIIAEKGDLIQILDFDQVTNVHTLGHMTQAPKSSGDFDDIDAPKLARWSECPIGASVRVTPGDKLVSYSVVDGFDSGNSLTSCSSNRITKGLANNSDNAQSDINQRFWRETREPKWTAPTLTATLVGNSVKLNWDKALIDINPNDKTSGYLIMKVKKQFSTNQIPPVDGTVYNVGDPIGFGTVVANIDNSKTLEFWDNSKTDCGDEYLFRIYAYRYNNGNNPNFAETVGRGRSYQTANKSFAQTEFKKDSPPVFSIRTKDIITDFCNLDTTVIFNDIPSASKSLFIYTWYRDNVKLFTGNNLEEMDSLIVRQSGRYRLDLENSSGCVVSSNIINIRIVKKPVIVLRNDRDASFLTKDTTIFLCAGETFVFNSSGNADKKEWFKNGVSVSPNSFTFNTKDNGTYKVIYSNQGICYDSSAAITLKFLEYDLDFEVDTLQMQVGTIDTEVDVTFKIKNNKNDLISLDGFNLNISPLSNYKILEVAPYIIPASGEIALTARLTMPSEGKIQGFIILNDPCKNRDTLFLNGFKLKAQTTYTLSDEEINLKPLLICDLKQVDTVLTITNIGNVPINLDKEIINNPFSISNSPLPTSIPVGGTLDLTISFNANTINQYTDKLILNGNTVEGPLTIELPIKAEISIPKYDISPKNITFPILSDCEMFKDTVVKISNTGVFDIDLSSQFTNANIEILNLPLTIKPNESADVQVRFRPTSNGEVTFKDNFTILPCNVTNELEVNGEKNGVIYNIENDTLDYGFIYNCIENQDAISKNSLKILIPSGLEVIIKDIIITNGFTSNLTIGQKLSQNNEIEITQNNYIEGIYNGSVKLILDPCDAEVEFDLKAERVNLVYDLVDTVYYNPIFQNEISSNYIAINNTNKFPITIDNLTGLNTLFSLKAGINLPMEIAPNGSDTIWIEYTNPRYANDTLNIELELLNPCVLKSNIVLVAQSMRLPVPPGQLEGGVVGDFTTKSGVIVNYNLKINGVNNYDIIQTDLSKTEIYLSYNPTLLIPKNVTIGNSLIKDTAIKVSYNEDIIGKLTIIIDHKDFTQITYGDWLNLTFMGLSGDSENTFITVDSINFTSLTDLTFTEIEKGKYTMIGQCNLNGVRNLDFTTSAFIRFDNGNVLTSLNNNLTFDVLSDEITTINIYDNEGRKIDNIINNKLKVSSYSIPFDITNYNNGFYFMTLTNGLRNETIKFIIQK